ncbi:pheromone processing endoprotease, partial [Podila clonocystis]
MVFSRPRRNIFKWTTPAVLLLVLARICTTDPHFRPQYDHQNRDYYVIRISDPQQLQELQDYHTNDQQQHHHHILGELLGLRFESRVGSLPDYFLYSTLKLSLPPHHHHHQGQDHTNRSESFSEENASSSSTTSHLQKRSLDNLHLGTPGQGVQVASLDTVDSIDDALDPVIQRFLSLKQRHEQQQHQHQQQQQQQPHSKVKRDLSFYLFSDDSSRKSTKNDDLVALSQSRFEMQDIQKQRLRQRIKKRAPLPEPMVHAPVFASVVQNTERDDEEGDERENREQEQEEAEIEAELESDQEEQELDAAVQEEEGEDSKDENDDGEKDGEEGEGEGGGGEAEEETEETSENESETDNPQIEYQPAGESQPDDGLAEAFGIEDPGFRYQWHLHNTKDGHDINVTGVWEQGIIGKGVNVAIIDDGLDMTSEDLAPNFFKEGSWDFNDHTALPMPRLFDDQHGTRCAGEIAAAKNDLCGLGVAYGAKVAGLRILSGQITD